MLHLNWFYQCMQKPLRNNKFSWKNKASLSCLKKKKNANGGFDRSNALSARMANLKVVIIWLLQEIRFVHAIGGAVQMNLDGVAPLITVSPPTSFTTLSVKKRAGKSGNG